MLQRRIAQIISWVALAAVILPPILFLNGSMDLPTLKRIMLTASIIWFVAAPSWMGKRNEEPVA